MKQAYRSAGAIVVSRDPTNPMTLLLEQVRASGERQVVAPKGTIEAGESPLAAAAREVREETGITDLAYVGFLGQQRYTFTDYDGSPAEKTVDWFLFATEIGPVQPRAVEGFVSARWQSFSDAADAASHAGFRSYLDSAADIITWRRPAGNMVAMTLSDSVWRLTDETSGVLADQPEAGIALCGSAARGDFVIGWSDLDLVGWGIKSGSSIAAHLTEIVTTVEREWKIQVSLRLAAPDGTDISQAGPLSDQKLRAVLSRTAIDTPVIAGNRPPLSSPIADSTDLGAIIDSLRDFAVQRLSLAPSSIPERIDRARRVLSVLCSGARTAAVAVRPDTNLRLVTVVGIVDELWPNSATGALLSEYDNLRRTGRVDLAGAELLAEQVPSALREMRVAAAEPAAGHATGSSAKR
jgi:8-oxo-dGTP pyrophosphatase MutT (NUDIX family)